VDGERGGLTCATGGRNNQRGVSNNNGAWRGEGGRRALNAAAWQRQSGRRCWQRRPLTGRKAGSTAAIRSVAAAKSQRVAA